MLLYKPSENKPDIMKNLVESYSYGKVAQPDSALYYSLRKLKACQRDSVVAVHAFYREIETILLECQDHDLALVKLNWWRQEVTQLTEGRPDHPVMVLLQKNVIPTEKIQNRLFNIIDGFEQNSLSSHFETFDEVVVHWMRTAGERELLLQALVQKEETMSPDIIYQLMLLIEIVNYVQHLRLYVRHAMFYFSQDELQKCNVTPSMLTEYITTDAIKKLLQHQTEKIERVYAEIKKLSLPERKMLSQLVVRCEIAYQTFREIQKSQFCVLENLIKLTPLRYWWIVFRCSGK